MVISKLPTVKRSALSSQELKTGRLVETCEQEVLGSKKFSSKTNLVDFVTISFIFVIIGLFEGGMPPRGYSAWECFTNVEERAVRGDAFYKSGSF